ncbi:unnamed protein product [Owenia fusiformis]|uniref:Uncharacterized protein n=1 Tax=Owenia fusiformis TaxID=6347 RepID=A0A8S4P5A6_OWEFU|nr:unnamed protein product [Owenia fusiformis]
MERIIQILCILGTLSMCIALECYVCENQDNNHDKCVKTVVQCREGEDTCRSVVKWGVPPYWAPHNERIYKISKFCDRRSECNAKEIAGSYKCKRDWYNDWECTECCAGDLCNFYVTMGANSMTSNLVTLAMSTILSAVFLWRQT